VPRSVPHQFRFPPIRLPSSGSRHESRRPETRGWPACGRAPDCRLFEAPHRLRQTLG
jgi:hypothetical protein